MIKTWDLIRNEKRIKVVKEYLKLLEKKRKVPKQAFPIICKKYTICRKTLYNWLKKFKNIPV